MASRIQRPHWIKALRDDAMTNLLLQMVENPSLCDTEANIKSLHHVYRQPARHGHFSVRDDILYMKEIFEDDTKYGDLRIVPDSLVNIICRVLKSIMQVKDNSGIKVTTASTRYQAFKESQAH